jgi:hypothetical protein
MMSFRAWLKKVAESIRTILRSLSRPAVTWIMIGALVLLVVGYVSFLNYLDFLPVLALEEGGLSNHVVRFWFFSSIAVIARWITLSARDIRKPDVDLVLYLNEWVADLVSTPLIVVILIFCLRIPRLQLGEHITLALEQADAELLTALSFLLGFFGSNTYELFGGIRDWIFSVKAKIGPAPEKESAEPSSPQNQPGLDSDQIRPWVP